MQLPQFQAHAALEESHWWFLGRRQIVAELIHAFLSPSKDASIIDVGCGTGGMTAFLSREYSCIGIDPTEDPIRFAQQRFPHCTFIRGTAPDDVAEQFRTADLILLLEVLEHIEGDRAFVHRLIEQMQPGAYLLLMAPADMSLWGPHDVGFEHFRRYDLQSLRETWAGTPMTEHLISYCNSRLYPLAKFMRWVGRLRGKAWGPGDTDLALPSSLVNDLLLSIFGGEAGILRELLDGKRREGFRRGVSVIAVLQKRT